MPGIPTIIVATLVAMLGCSSALAGDFVPRATGNFSALGDDPGARSSCPEAATNVAMSEVDTTQAQDTSSARVVHVGPTRSAKHIGVDDVAADAHTTTGAEEQKPVGAPAASPHKSRAPARWQSLLPGVMK